jgi:2-hydroxy-6-oxonona-2,4-dienedioate hydrolase
MTTTIFQDDNAKNRIATWFETFRSTLAFETESRRIETPFGETHVLVTGPADAPPLVCLHGALASSAHLLPELGTLVNRYRIYAVDVIGQSVMSADRRLDVRDDSYGTWLAAVCKGLGLSNVSIFGVSWGGFVALRTAKVAPELISALVLLVPAGVVAGPAWAGFAQVGWPMLTYRLSPSEKRLRRLFSALFTTHDDRWEKYFGDAVLSYRFDMRIPPLAKEEELAAFAARKRPTLFLGGDGDVSFPGQAVVDRAKQLIPHAEIELLPSCKHCPPFDEAFRAQTADRIHAFVSRAQTAS